MRPYFVWSAAVLVTIFILLYFFYTPAAKVPRAVQILSGTSVSQTVRVTSVGGLEKFQPTPVPPRSSGTGVGSGTVSSATPADNIHATSLKTKPTTTKPKMPRAANPPAKKQIMPTTPNIPTHATPSSLARSAKILRKALVNILCTTSLQSKIRSISGSGVLISSKGIILTNAHIGQYFLLTNYPSTDATHCVIRTGSPATDAYHASLLFISPAWIYANPEVLTEVAPTGTGKYDIALLVITKSTTNASLPPTFPFVPLATLAPTIAEPVIIGSYAAQFLSINEIKYSLYPTIVYGAVKNIYTLTATSSDTVDVTSFGGTAAAQEGSSGGGVLSATGELISTITTSTIKGTTGNRTLYAITAPYIRRDYATETSKSLATLLKESTSTAKKTFAPEISKLTTFLTHVLTTH